MRVWDLPLRFFHWLLVAAIIAAYITGELSGLWLSWHAQIGLIVLGLLVFRLLWGMMGTTYARFRTFYPTLGRIRDYMNGRWHGLGHNPLGALSVFTMLLLLVCQVVTGLFAYNDEVEFYGPLASLISDSWSRRITHWHEELFDILLVFIVMHLIAIAYYAIVKHKNLTKAMITGDTPISADTKVLPLTGGGLWRFIAASIIASSIVGLIQIYY